MTDLDGVKLQHLIARARDFVAHKNVHFHYRDGAEVMAALVDALEAALSPTPEAPGTGGAWKWLPEDLLTHLGDWQTACQIARHHAAPATVDSDDKGYWDHQLRTIANIRAMLAATPAETQADEAGK